MVAFSHVLCSHVLFHILFDVCVCVRERVRTHRTDSSHEHGSGSEKGSFGKGVFSEKSIFQRF